MIISNKIKAKSELYRREIKKKKISYLRLTGKFYSSFGVVFFFYYIKKIDCDAILPLSTLH